MNNVNLIGRIETDVKAGNGVISTLLAVKRIYKSKDGQNTDFIQLSIFGHQAENFQKMVSKGQLIGVDGQLKTSTYADENREKRYSWSVVVNHFYLLSSKTYGDKSKDSSTRINDVTFHSLSPKIKDSDLPF